MVICTGRSRLLSISDHSWYVVVFLMTYFTDHFIVYFYLLPTSPTGRCRAPTSTVTHNMNSGWFLCDPYLRLFALSYNPPIRVHDVQWWNIPRKIQYTKEFCHVFPAKNHCHSCEDDLKINLIPWKVLIYNFFGVLSFLWI